MGCIYFETVLNDFCLEISSDSNYFSSCPRHCDQGLIVVNSILFSHLKKKNKQTKLNKQQHISRVISSHMYIKKPYMCLHSKSR